MRIVPHHADTAFQVLLSLAIPHGARHIQRNEQLLSVTNLQQIL